MVYEVNKQQNNWQYKAKENFCKEKRSQNTQKHYKSFSALNGFNRTRIIENSNKESSLIDPVACSSNNSSNAALPRLANALRSLISSNGGFSKSRSACVDAGDELIYYSNGSGPSAASRKSPLMTKNANSKSEIDNNEAEDENFLSASSTTSSSNFMPNHQFTSLEQIHQLYKSMPNFASFEEEEEQKLKFQQTSNSFNTQFDNHLNHPYYTKNLLIKNNPPPLQMPQRRKLIAACSDRSSFSSLSSSAKSAVSVPINNTMDIGGNILGGCQFYSSSIERVAEQCEKIIPVSTTTTIKQLNNSPIASCSLSGCCISSVDKCQQKAKSDIYSKNKITNYNNESTDSGYLSTKSNHNKKSYWPNMISWLDALEWIYNQKIEFVNKKGEKDKEEMFQILLINHLNDFKVVFEVEENLLDKKELLLKKRIEWLAELLFNLLVISNSSSLKQDILKVIASTISTLFRQILKNKSLKQSSKHYFQKKKQNYYNKNHAIQQNRQLYNGIDSSLSTQIDPKFVDCSDLSDIRFRFADGRIVYAHRIVLVNASEEFRQILKNPSGIVDLPDSDADTFRLILEFVYGNVSKCSQIISSQMNTSKQMAICTLARRFGLEKLVSIAELAVSSFLQNNVFSSEMFESVYLFAKEMHLNVLMEECERYVLLNFSELLSLFFEDNLNNIKNEQLLIKMKEILLKSLNQK